MPSAVAERTPDPDDYVAVGLGIMALELYANQPPQVEPLGYAPGRFPLDPTIVDFDQH